MGFIQSYLFAFVIFFIFFTYFYHVFRFGKLVTKLHKGRKYYNGLADSRDNHSPKAGFLPMFSVKKDNQLSFTIAGKT